MYSTPDIIIALRPKRERLAGHVLYMRLTGNAYRNFDRELEENRLFLRPRYRWEYNIKTDLKGLGFVNANSIPFAKYRDQWWNLFVHDNEVLGSIKGGGFLDRLSEWFVA